MPSIRAIAAGASLFLVGIAFLAVPTTGPHPSQDAGSYPPEASPTRRAETLAVPFVEQAAGTPTDVRFTAATFAGSVHVTGSGEILYDIAGADGPGVRLREHAAASHPCAVEAGERSPTRFNRFVGNDPQLWQRDLPTFRTVHVRGVAQGVSLEVAAYDRNVEKRFHVEPGADAAGIAMQIDGGDGLQVLETGELEVATARGPVTFTRPIAFQERDGKREYLSASYVTHGTSYGFDVEGRDDTLALVIDPLIAATYAGGNEVDWANDIQLYDGAVYVAGSTRSPNFPVAGDPYRSDLRPEDPGDAVLCRLDHELTTLEVMTLVGASGIDEGYGLLVDESGVFLVGSTVGNDFPGTSGGFQPDPGQSSDRGQDGFAARFDHDLFFLQEATYIGGNATDSANLIAQSGSELFIAGSTRSDDFQVPEWGWEGTHMGVHDVFILRVNQDLSQVTSGTLYGGRFSDEPHGMTVVGRDVFVVGETSSTDLPLSEGAYDTTYAREREGFIARFPVDLGQLTASTYLGGDEGEYPGDVCTDVAFHADELIVCGGTAAFDFPTTDGAFDVTPNSGEYGDVYGGFVVRMDPNLTSLHASTLFGGAERDDLPHALIVHPEGLVLAGETRSPDFPVAPTGWDTTLGGGEFGNNSDAFLIAFTHDLTQRIDGTYLGGDGHDQARAMMFDGGTFFLAGGTTSPDFPATPGAFDETFNDEGFSQDMFVAAMTLDFDEPPIVIDAYILPKRVDVIHNTKKPAKSSLNTGGFFDTGSRTVDFSQPATLTVGSKVFQIPGLDPWKKTWWQYQDGPLDFRIKPSRYGSSKAKFKLKLRGAEVLDIDRDKPLQIRFQRGDLDAVGKVTMKAGRYKLGRVRGALLEPQLSLYSYKTVLKGDSKDGMRARFGLATGQGTPDTPPPLTLGLGGYWADTAESDGFKEQKPGKYVFRGEKGGVTFAKADYAKEKLAIHCKKVDAGNFPDGPQTVQVSVRVGEQQLILIVRMNRDGKIMRY